MPNKSIMIKIKVNYSDGSFKKSQGQRAQAQISGVSIYKIITS